MAKTETITIRVNPDLKHEAEALCADMGLTLSTAYTMLLKAIVRTRSIPFPIHASDANPKNSKTKESIVDAFKTASLAFAGTAEKAGFKDEDELQHYVKEVIRPKVWEERNRARNA